MSCSLPCSVYELRVVLQESVVRCVDFEIVVGVCLADENDVAENICNLQPVANLEADFQKSV